MTKPPSVVPQWQIFQSIALSSRSCVLASFLHIYTLTHCISIFSTRDQSNVRIQAAWFLASAKYYKMTLLAFIKSTVTGWSDSLHKLNRIVPLILLFMFKFVLSKSRIVWHSGVGFSWSYAGMWCFFLYQKQTNMNNNVPSL